jgi:branched-chain amino acid transport system permease protein
MVVSTLGLALIGVVAYYLLFRRFTHSARAEMAIVSTLGLGLMLQYGVLGFAGGDARRLVTPMTSQTVSLGLTQISAARLAVIGLSALAIGSLAAWLKWSRPGRAIRAISQNREAAEVVGISSDRMSALAITVGLALAGVAAGALTPLYGVFPFVGQVLVMKAFAIVVLAGFGSLPGTAVAALGVGIAESIAGGLGSAAMQNSAAFLILIIALVLRPQGLFGKGVRVA